MCFFLLFIIPVEQFLCDSILPSGTDDLFSANYTEDDKSTFPTQVSDIL